MNGLVLGGLPSLACDATPAEHLYRAVWQHVSRQCHGLAKLADTPMASYSLAGRLIASASGWLLLSVPNALVRGAFDALDEPGVELPLKNGVLNAHISVMTAAEVESLGGPDAISERGKIFHYNLGPVKSVTPDSWDGISKAYFCVVSSPELKQLRKSYGLTPLPHGDHEFHITIAVRRTGVLGLNEVSKAPAAKAAELAPAEEFDLLGQAEWACCPDDEPLLTKCAADFATGIPSAKDYGDLSKLREGELARWIVQKHDALRAGKHYDLRVGHPDVGLFSWATRKELPPPGQRIAVYQTPLHRYSYGDFQGMLKGYGAGRVTRHDKGDALITKAGPDAVHFTLAHKGEPQRYVLVRPKAWSAETARSRPWLLLNTTPTAPIPYQKIRFRSVPHAEAEKSLAALPAEHYVSPKIDGAAALTRLGPDGRVEVVSYRTSKRNNGRPIIHTERMFGNRPHLATLPPELAGTILRGELYGVRGEGESPEVIPPWELGGVLNASLSNSLAKQRAGKIQLRQMLFDIQQHGKRPIDSAQMSYPERRKLLEEVLRHLPADQFHLAPGVSTPEEAQKLWNDVREGRHPLTREGVVIHPPHGKPHKLKLTDEHDVWVTGVFPGEGGLAGQGAGGIEYSAHPGGPTLGRVGTGFSADMRRELYERPEEYIGRAARIRSQEVLPSGAHRAPAFLAFHEDMPYAVGAAPAEEGEEKAGEAESHFGRAWAGTPFQPDPQRPLLGNLISHLQTVHQKGKENLRQADAARELELAQADPAFANGTALQSFVASLHGADPAAPAAMDRLLARIG